MNVFDYFRPKTMSIAMKVFITDDHAILTDGLVNLLKNESHTFEVCGTAASVTETLEKFKKNVPDILITDYNLPDEDGLTLVRHVKRIFPNVKIIVLSMHDEAHLIKEILKAGIHSYILKKDTHEHLIEALYAVKNDKIYLSNDVNKMLMTGLHSEEPKLLTEREREIVKLIAQELNNRQIAETLFISERTVETHRKNIMRKTGTNNMVGLLKFAYANNII